MPTDMHAVSIIPRHTVRQIKTDNLFDLFSACFHQVQFTWRNPMGRWRRSTDEQADRSIEYMIKLMLALDSAIYM